MLSASSADDFSRLYPIVPFVAENAAVGHEGRESNRLDCVFVPRAQLLYKFYLLWCKFVFFHV